MNPTERTALRRCEEEEREREKEKGKRKMNERTHQIAMWDGNTEGGGRGGGGGGGGKGVLNFWCGEWRGCNDEKVQGLRSSGEFREVVASGRDQLCSWQAAGWAGSSFPLLPPSSATVSKQAQVQVTTNHPILLQILPPSGNRITTFVPYSPRPINILTPRIEGETTMRYK